MMIELLLLVIYLPIVQKGYESPPLFNEQMVDLYYDVDLPTEEYAVWAYLDPSPHVADLQDITYTPPPGYLVKGAWWYTYDAGLLISSSTNIKNVERCQPAFAYEDGERIFIGGEWCVTHISTTFSIYGDEGYRFRNTSPYSVDVFMFNVVVDPDWSTKE